MQLLEQRLDLGGRLEAAQLDLAQDPLALAAAAAAAAAARARRAARAVAPIGCGRSWLGLGSG